MRRGLLAALVVLLVLPSTASAWTTPRTVGTLRYGGELGLAFNARGDAILTAHSETRGFTAVRPAGGRFGRPRAFRTKYAFDGPRAVLDMDRSALLLGAWYHQAPEFEEPESRDECCYRVFAKPISRHGRSGRTRVLTPYGIDSVLVRVETDERGRAGIVISQGEGGLFGGGLFGALRPRGGAVGALRPIELPPRGLFEQIAVRPDGRGLAAWGDYNKVHVGYAPVARDGSLGAHRTVFRRHARGRAVLRDLLIGRRGHAWLMWGVERSGTPDRETFYVARRGRDGSFGAVRKVGSGTGVQIGAVDDAGNLTVVWEDRRGLVARFVSRGGRLDSTRRVVDGRPQDTTVAAGPRGRSVVVWETSRRRGRNAYFAELKARVARNGRLGPMRTLERGVRNETFGGVALGISRRGAAIAAWNQTPQDGRVRIRYSVLAP